MDDALSLPIEADTTAFVANLARAATALEKLAGSNDDAKEKTEKHDAALKQLTDSIGKAADRAKDGVEVFEMWAERILGSIEHVAALSTEAERLARVQDDLGVSLEEAQNNAIGFANETDIATAALSLQERGVRATQQELNAMTRLASSYARTTGKEFAEAMEMVTEVVTEGGEEMGKLDLSLLRVADGSHTAGQRLAAMVERANEIEDSTDTATDAVERFKDGLHDMSVEAASAFNQSFVRLAGIAEETRDAAEATEEWRTTMHALGDTAAEVMVRTGEGAGALAGILGTGLGLVADAVALAATGLSELAAGNFSGLMDRLEEDFAMRFERGDGFAGTAVSFARNRIAALERLDDATADRTSATPEGFVADMTFTSDQVAGMDRDRRLRNRSNDSLSGQSSKRKTLAQLMDAAGGRTSSMRELFRGNAPDSLAVLTDAGLFEESAQTERDVGKSDAARTAQEAAFGQSDDTRLRDRRRDRTTERERREQETRLDQRESFVERWERLNNREIVANDVYAEALQATFEATCQSLATHFEGLAAGRETAAEFFEGLAADTMAALGKEAFGKGAFYTAEALGFAVTGNLASAGTAGAAAGAYFVAGGLLTAGAAALGGDGGSAPSTGGGGGGGSPSRPRLAGGGGSESGQNTTTTIVYQYAPTFGGRQGSDAEAGRQVQRYTGAEDRRRVDRGRS